MSGGQRLLWRDAELRDRKALQVFKCTDAEPRLVVTPVGKSVECDRVFEWQVQEAIRGLRVPKSKSWTVRVGLDAEGLGAVMVSQEIDPGELYDLTYGAVAMRLHGQRIGQEMMKDTFDVITSRSAELGVTEEVKVVGMVHHENVASQKMCGGAGLRCEGPTKDDDVHFDWVRHLPLPQLGEA